MTRREVNLSLKGYLYIKGHDSNEDAKEHAKRMRQDGYRATVLTEERNGIYYFSVWAKKVN